eukprot:1150873-Heterocapsa_arctica.AAC.1
MPAAPLVRARAACCLALRTAEPDVLGLTYCRYRQKVGPRIRDPDEEALPAPLSAMAGAPPAIPASSGPPVTILERIHNGHIDDPDRALIVLE